jgi:hypothetical protein
MFSQVRNPQGRVILIVMGACLLNVAFNYKVSYTECGPFYEEMKLFFFFFLPMIISFIEVHIVSMLEV